MQMQTLPHTSIDVFITSLTNALQGLVAGDSSQTSCELTRFHAPRTPSISIRQYVERVVSYAPCTVECFVVALIYIERIQQLQKAQGVNFVNPRTIHRLFITSILLSAKYTDDIYFNNKYYARVGGISCAEMNALELEFLFRVKFDCNTHPEEFKKHSHILYDPKTPKATEPVAMDSMSIELNPPVYSVSPATHSFMFPACGVSNAVPVQTKSTYRHPMVTF